MILTTALQLILVLPMFMIPAVLAKNKIKRSLRWVTKGSAVSFVTKEMSYMKEFKEDVLKPIMKERVSGTPENKEVQEHIKKFLSNLGWTVEEDNFVDKTPYGDKEFTNIIGTFDPSKSKRVVIACHFDSKYFPKGGFMGATDSAVPCAIMLETARQLDCLLRKGPKDKSSAKDVTLQMIFLDGEEAFKEWTSTDSIYGARHLATKWDKQSDENGQKELSKIREFILLDLIGTSDTKFSKQFEETSELYKHLSDIEKLLRKEGLLTGKHPGPIFSLNKGWGKIEDDHIPFMMKGVPILHLISTPFPKVWHKMSDNWQNLDFDLIDDFSRIFRLFVSNLLHLRPEDRGCRKK